MLLALPGFAALDHLLHEVSVHEIRHVWHAMLAWRPEVLAVEGVHLPPDIVRSFGIALLLAIVALLVWTGRRGGMSMSEAI